MPLDRHSTIVAIVVVAFGLFFLEDIFGVAIVPDWKTVPAEVEKAATSIGNGAVTLHAVKALTTQITALLLHADLDHVLFNMVYLWAFGSLTSQHLGQWWALALFFVTGLCGNLLHLALNWGSPIGLLGASGAVSGFEGIYLGLALRWSIRWPDVWPLAHPIPPMQLCLFAIIGVVLDFSGLIGNEGNTAHEAHIGGFLSGLAIAWLITSVYHSEDRWRSRWQRRR